MSAHSAAAADHRGHGPRIGAHVEVAGVGRAGVEEAGGSAGGRTKYAASVDAQRIVVGDNGADRLGPSVGTDDATEIR